MKAMRGHGLILVAALAGAVVSAAGCGENDVPTTVTYHQHIKPFMEAHCTRCHGAGGTLNPDPYSVPVAGAQKPVGGDFTQLADDAAGKHGLMFYATTGRATMSVYVDMFGMPPAPAPPLTSWEHDLLFQWINNPLP